MGWASEDRTLPKNSDETRFPVGEKFSSLQPLYGLIFFMNNLEWRPTGPVPRPAITQLAFERRSNEGFYFNLRNLRGIRSSEWWYTTCLYFFPLDKTNLVTCGFCKHREKIKFMRSDDRIEFFTLKTNWRHNYSRRQNFFKHREKIKMMTSHERVWKSPCEHTSMALSYAGMSIEKC